MSEHGITVGFGAALLEQFAWFWRRLWIWIVIVTVLTAGASAWIISSIPDDGAALAPMLVGNAFHPLLVLIALSWALSAWRDDPPKDRQYFWLHPVERTSHTIARSLAGFLWLLVVAGVVIATTLIATRGFLPPTSGVDAPRMWAYSAAAITLAYFAASIASVLSDRPGLWLVAVVAVVTIAGVIADIRELDWLESAVDVFSGGARSFATALFAPGYEAGRIIMEEIATGTTGATVDMPNGQRIAAARPGEALAIWLPISIAAYVAAAALSRPR